MRSTVSSLRSLFLSRDRSPLRLVLADFLFHFRHEKNRSGSRTLHRINAKKFRTASNTIAVLSLLEGAWSSNNKDEKFIEYLVRRARLFAPDFLRSFSPSSSFDFCSR